jgi:hypothetical protein
VASGEWRDRSVGGWRKDNAETQSALRSAESLGEGIAGVASGAKAREKWSSILWGLKPPPPKERVTCDEWRTCWLAGGSGGVIGRGGGLREAFDGFSEGLVEAVGVEAVGAERDFAVAIENQRRRVRIHAQ